MRKDLIKKEKELQKGLNIKDLPVRIYGNYIAPVRGGAIRQTTGRRGEGLGGGIHEGTKNHNGEWVILVNSGQSKCAFYIGREADGNSIINKKGRGHNILRWEGVGASKPATAGA